MIYEVVNFSDECTLVSHCPKVALVACSLVGMGMHALEPPPYMDRPAAMGILAYDLKALDVVHAYIGATLDDFIAARWPEVVAVLRSYAYLSREQRALYDDALASITDPALAAAFRAKHEDRRRTSMNPIVKRAWKLADKLEKKNKPVPFANA